MKKLLILMLVLGLASAANAALEISVNGDKDPIDSQIEIEPSQHLTLDIWTTTQILPGVGEGYYVLACNAADATISGGASQFPTEPGLSIEGDPGGVGIPLPPGHDGVWGAIALSVLPSIDAGSVLFDLIDFHCIWQPNDVVITLYDADTMQVLDTVTIHQIPEPASMLLLGLGGLLLRRRK